MNVGEDQTTYLSVALVLFGVLFLGLSIYLAYKVCQLKLKYRRLKDENIKQQRELRSLESQLKLSQIKPHFLYNVLNSISALCDIEPQRAKTMISNFADYLRGNLQALQSKELIGIGKELEHVVFYLKLEKERFEDKLNYTVKVNCKNFMVPPLTLQPLVENAVKHGIRYKSTAGKVTITTSENPAGYEIVVKDDGVGFEANAVDFASGKHVGINNVKNRLKLLCNGSFSIESKAGAGTVVTVFIPKKK